MVIASLNSSSAEKRVITPLTLLEIIFLVLKNDKCQQWLVTCLVACFTWSFGVKLDSFVHVLVVYSLHFLFVFVCTTSTVFLLEFEVIFVFVMLRGRQWIVSMRWSKSQVWQDTISLLTYHVVWMIFAHGRSPGTRGLIVRSKAWGRRRKWGKQIYFAIQERLISEPSNPHKQQLQVAQFKSG